VHRAGESYAIAVSAGEPSFIAAWPICDRAAFRSVKAKILREIMLDLKITNHEKAALQVIIGHMNPDEHWSCYAAIPTLAEEAKVCERVVWNAIKKASGKYVQTRSARRPGCRFPVTYITLFKVHAHAPCNAHRVHVHSPTECTNMHNNSSKRTYRERGVVQLKREGSFLHGKLFIKAETPQWEAWQKVKRTPQTDHRVDGKLERGWRFPAEWPQKPASFGDLERQETN